MASIILTHAERIPWGSAAVPTRLRMITRLIARATPISNTYSKTACPEADLRISSKPMNDELDSNSGTDSDSRSGANSESGGRAPKSERPKRTLGLPLWGKVLVMSLLVFLGSLSYLRSHIQSKENAQDIQAEPSDVPSADKRKDVPDIALFESLKGPSKKLSQYKGHVVLLSFWASWCTPCLVELPSFIDLHEKLAAKGLVIIPVNVDEANAEAEAGTGANFVNDFWKTKKFPFPTFFDPQHKSSEVFKVDSLPSNFVLDKKGKLVAQGYGANDWASEPSVKFIEQLLREP